MITPKISNILPPKFSTESASLSAPANLRKHHTKQHMPNIIPKVFKIKYKANPAIIIQGYQILKRVSNKVYITVVLS